MRPRLLRPALRARPLRPQRAKRPRPRLKASRQSPLPGRTRAVTRKGGYVGKRRWWLVALPVSPPRSLRDRTQQHRDALRSARSVATIPSVPALLASALCVWIFIGCGLAAAQFQFPAPECDAARSRSGQFIIYGANIPGLSAPALDLGTNVNLIRLQPALLTVSCERIKEMLWHELGATAPWRGKIYITVFAAQTADDTITV